MLLFRHFASALALTLLLTCPAPTLAADQPLPTPDTVSPELQALIAAPPSPIWNAHPASADEWKKLVGAVADASLKMLPGLREKLGVTLTKGELGGVPVFYLTPAGMPAERCDRLLINLHGGGYVLNPGESGTLEATLMAGLGGYRVVYVDYRMAPDHPYPAAIDDALAVYRELLKTVPAEKIGVFGTSTGGAMTLILPLSARTAGLPMPAALGAGTPWSDLTRTGDTYFTNEGRDNMLVTYDGWLGDAARIYAAGHDMKDPMLSPVYGDLSGFPPTMLTSGTRDLFLSNTVRVHLKLREAGVPADLIVFEGMSHAQYHILPDAPETKLHFTELARFFDRYMQAAGK
ncbi:MAG: alpha/beta hydrolase [Desulfovibrionaceae bacterium]|nr:alpha/beta hydrolase [Desulfovibrionaceae bacterium]